MKIIFREIEKGENFKTCNNNNNTSESDYIIVYNCTILINYDSKILLAITSIYLLQNIDMPYLSLTDQNNPKDIY